MTGSIVVLATMTELDEAVAAATPGTTVCCEDWASVMLIDEDGSADELCPDEHPMYVHVGDIHGRPEPDEVDLDDTEFLQGRLCRIGAVYFNWLKDDVAWEWVGVFVDEADAIDVACGPDFEFRP